MPNQVEVWALSLELGATMDVQRDPLTITITAPDGFVWVATDCDTISDQTNSDDSKLWNLVYKLMSRGLKISLGTESLPRTEVVAEMDKKDGAINNAKNGLTDTIKVTKTLAWFAIIIIVIWGFVTVAPVWATVLLAVIFLLWAYG